MIRQIDEPIQVSEFMIRKTPSLDRVNSIYQFKLRSAPGTLTGRFRVLPALGSQDLTRGPLVLDLTSGASGIFDITLFANAAELTGVVHDSTGAVLPDVTVSLWTPGLPPKGAPDTSRSPYTNERGVFRFRNLPPGEYRVAAWER